MTTQTIRHRTHLRTARSLAHTTAAEWEWRAAPRTVIIPCPPAPTPPNALERFSRACWRVHDGYPAVWALLGAVLVIASGALGVAMVAVGLGWRP